MGLVYSVVVGAIVLEAVEDVETRGPRDIATTLAIYGWILVLKVAVFVFLRTRPEKSLSLIVDVSASGMYRLASMQGLYQELLLTIIGGEGDSSHVLASI